MDALANREPAIPPSQVQPNIDPWLEAICTKAIAHQPSRRFQSARELADALQCYLSVVWFRPNSTNSYDGEIWTASRSSMSDDFNSARLLGSGINTKASEQHPCISESGLLLMFDRGTPEPRLWQARRDHTTDDFGDAYPVRFLGENAYCPSFTSDCKLMIFTSNVVPGKEGFETGELWQSRLP